MANHKCTVYTRTAGTRSFERAYPNTTYPTGTTFCIRYKQGSQRRWDTLQVATYAEAVVAAMQRQLELFQRDGANYDHRTAITKLKEVPAFVEPPAPEQPKVAKKGKVALDAAMDQYNKNVATRSGRTVSGYAFTMGQFYKSCRKPFVQDVRQQDLIDFVGFLRATGAGDRTISNRVGEVITFLRASGVTDVKLKVRYTEKVVEAYSEEEIKALFAASDAEERLTFEFFLGSGCRDREVMFACYANINYIDKIYTVREKLDMGFTVKDREERRVPIPDSLVEALRARRQRYPNATLIFTNSKGGPQGHFLRMLKKVVKRAGLPGHWELHKFRKSMASMHHEHGVSARTLQKWLGHSDLTTIESYLAVADMRSERTRTQVNHSFACFA